MMVINNCLLLFAFKTTMIKQREVIQNTAGNRTNFLTNFSNKVMHFSFANKM